MVAINLITIALTAFIPAITALPTTLAANCLEGTVHNFTESDHGTTVYSCGSAFTVMAVDSAQPKHARDTSDLTARCTDPVTYSIQQTQIVASGTWWDVWVQQSCVFCTESSGSCSKALTWSDTTTESFNVGFDIGTKDTVLGLIKGNSKFNLGYTWGHSFTKGGSFTCNINPHDKAAVWMQNQKGWADSQTRIVTTTRGCGDNGISYDPWSPSQRSNWALDGDKSVNLGCSSGEASGCL
ncbi:hypothetical protein B9Z65_7380 [Elsinoe australis]|uniref:Uncharacterized protein n=1 Tax=Elsinoe australis TaxID=40998 RepID=A0A2P7YC04_9PEZI|nr:hypothetical protein B9Z65_7380 [Elsinoe australis]